MIIDVWSWTMAPGKAQEAEDLLKRAAQYNNSQGVNTRVLSPDNGFLHKLFFEAEHESYAAMEKYLTSFFESDVWKDITKDVDSEGGWQSFFVEDRNERYQLTVVE